MKKIIATTLLFLMLFSNVGLTFETHYCGGEAINTSLKFGQESWACGMKHAENVCSNLDSQPKIKSKPCCENRSIQLLNTSNYYPKSSVLHPDQIPVFLVVFAAFLPKTLLNNSNSNFNFLNSPPPLLKTSKQVLFQSFLI